MPGSTISVFGEPDDYEAALRGGAAVDFLVTGCGVFRARLTRIALVRIHLLAGEETLPRIAFIRTPPRTMRVLLPVRSGAPLLWGATASRAAEIVTHAAGLQLHERTDGPSQWRTMWLPAKELIGYAGAKTGASFDLPPGICRWRPSPGALRSLTSLYDDAIRVNKTQPRLTAGSDAAHGLEQQLIQALVDCLSAERMVPLATTITRRHAEVMSRFEDVVRLLPERTPSVREISAALGVADRTLRVYCAAYLGMGPLRYLHLRRMQSAYRALREAGPDAAKVSEIARRHGFSAPSRFAMNYRAQFGELPSVTLRHGPA